MDYLQTWNCRLSVSVPRLSETNTAFEDDASRFKGF